MARLTDDEQIAQWVESLHERVENLSAIYKCDKVKHAVNVALTTDSITTMLLGMLLDSNNGLSDADIERVQDTANMALVSATMNALKLLDIPEDRAESLMGDVLQLIKSKYELEERLNGE